jgi:molybdopterin-guanine dinucleotide biosynthesis protein B
MTTVIGVVGRKNSGKTTLIVELLKALAPSLPIVVVKHVHHRGVVFDVEGTDTWRVRQSGARAVMALAPDQVYLNAGVRLDLDGAIDTVREWVPDVKLVVLEGFLGQFSPKPGHHLVVVARSSEEALELLAEVPLKPFAIYCPSCQEEQLNGVAVYNDYAGLIEAVKGLLAASDT